jgi:hypothetical protein
METIVIDCISMRNIRDERAVKRGGDVRDMGDTGYMDDKGDMRYTFY